jgi:hypothetical protein
MTPGRELQFVADPIGAVGCALDGDAVSGITHTGSNVAAVGADAAVALTCSRRHLNKRLALMPLFMAMRRDGHRELMFYFEGPPDQPTAPTNDKKSEVRLQRKRFVLNAPAQEFPGLFLSQIASKIRP